MLTLSSTPQTYQLDVLPFLVLLTVILLLPEVQQLLLLLLLQLHELLGHLRVECSQFLLNGGRAVVGAARLRPARTQQPQRVTRQLHPDFVYLDLPFKVRYL